VTLEMVASNTGVGFERISPLFVHLHDALHDFIGAQWGRHRGLLCKRRNADSQQSQRWQQTKCAKVRTLEKRTHHFLLHGKRTKREQRLCFGSLAYDSLSRVQTVTSPAE